MKLLLFIFYLLTFAACRDHTDLAGQLKRITDSYKAYKMDKVLAEFAPNVEYLPIVGGRQIPGRFEHLRKWLYWLRQNNLRVEFNHVRTRKGPAVTEADYQLTHWNYHREYKQTGTIYVSKSTGKIIKITRVE